MGREMDFCVFVCVCSVSSPSALVIKLIDFLIVPLSIVKEMNRVIRLGESGGRWRKIDFFFKYILFSIFFFLAPHCSNNNRHRGKSKRVRRKRLTWNCGGGGGCARSVFSSR
jgi:hypothetical protein